MKILRTAMEVYRRELRAWRNKRLVGFQEPSAFRKLRSEDTSHDSPKNPRITDHPLKWLDSRTSKRSKATGASHRGANAER